MTVHLLYALCVHIEIVCSRDTHIFRFVYIIVIISTFFFLHNARVQYVTVIMVRREIE